MTVSVRSTRVACDATAAKLEDVPLVLIVEDEPLMRKLIATRLSAHCRVARVEVGAEGLCAAIRLEPDLILSSIPVPRMNGLQFLEKVRAVPVLQDVPFILVSEHDDRDLRVQLLRLGALDLLPKPIDSDEMVARVANQIHMRRERQLLQRQLDMRQRDVHVLTRQMGDHLRETEKARAELQCLSRRLVDVQEAERCHLARELHDELGQELTALKLMLDMAAREAVPAVHSPIAMAQELVSQLIGHVGQLSLDLRPRLIEDLGLVSALLWFFDRYTKQTRIRVDFEHKGVRGRPRAAGDLAVYRIIQEALTNVSRHAATDRAEVRLTADDWLNVEILDHGVGFDVTAPLQAGGLLGMRERAHLLGGCLTVVSQPRCGTYIAARLPLEPRAVGV